VHMGPVASIGTGEEMKYALVLLCAIFCLSSNVMADNHSYVPDAGFVPDERTATQIAEAVLTPIYGAEAVKQERPFTASLKDGVWTVVGSLPRGAVGGVSLVEIASKDGRIPRATPPVIPPSPPPTTTPDASKLYGQFPTTCASPGHVFDGQGGSQSQENGTH
jgi:hypothetical protein